MFLLPITVLLVQLLFPVGQILAGSLWRGSASEYVFTKEENRPSKFVGILGLSCPLAVLAIPHQGPWPARYDNAIVMLS